MATRPIANQTGSPRKATAPRKAAAPKAAADGQPRKARAPKKPASPPVRAYSTPASASLDNFDHWLSGSLDKLANGDVREIPLPLREFSTSERALAERLIAVREYLADYSDRIDTMARGEYDASWQVRNRYDAVGTSVQKMMRLMDDMTLVCQTIASGDTDTRVIVKGSDDKLGVALNSVIDTLRNATEQAEVIAMGDFRTEVRAKSNKDRLGLALYNMTRTLRDVSQYFDVLGSGDVSRRFEAKGDNDLLGLSLSKLSDTLRNASDQADELSAGDYRAEIVPRGPADRLGYALAKMTRSLRDTSSIVAQIANGNLSQKIEIKGEGDLLGQSINQLVETLRDTTQRVDQIAGGDLSAQIVPRSNSDALSLAIAKMGNKLREMSLDADARQRLGQWQNSLAEQMRGEFDLKTLGERVLDVLVECLDAQVAVIYISSGPKSMTQVASYAFIHPRDTSIDIDIDQGMLGQCCTERRVRVIDAVPPGYLAVGSALGETAPHQLLLVPLVYQDQLYGAIEVATLGAFSPQHLALIDSMRESLALTISMTRSRERMSELLQESQAQSAELQAQQTRQKELRTTNQEMEEQTRMLKDSEELLKQQAGELQETNEELEEQTRMLKDSEELLKQQAGELQGSNEELEEQTRMLKGSEELLKQQAGELQGSNEELEEQTRMLKNSEERLKQQTEELQTTNEELEEKTAYLEKQRADILQKNIILDATRLEVEEQAAQLEVTSRYKSEFLANMSHELRTPLNSMLLLSRSLEENDEGNLTSEQQESLHVIHSGGHDLLNLINEILDLSKVEAGKMSLIYDELAIDSLYTRLRDLFTPVALQHKLELCFEQEEGVEGTLYTDGQRVEQVLKNLLSNAFKFTESGSVRVRVIKPPTDIHFRVPGLTATSCIGFAVQDTGIGIGEDQQKVVFEAFQQADGSTSRRYGGTGLGLTISRELTKLLGGELRLSSKEGVGSTFTLYVPLRPPEQQGSVAIQDAIQADASSPSFSFDAPATGLDALPQGLGSTKPAGAKQSGAKSGRPGAVDDDRAQIKQGERSILVIEDDDDFGKIVLGLAAKKGFKGLQALTGNDGLALARQYRPSAIILDLGLPDISGETVLEQLKYNLNTRHIPVHVVSARDKDPARLFKGSLGYLRKPVSKDELLKIFTQVERLIDSPLREVLLIEDDPGSQVSISRLLKNKQLKMQAAATAEIGLEALKARRYDLIILDLTLPGMSGQQFLKALHEEMGEHSPPVVVYTGKELSPQEYQDLRAYTDALVIKGVHSPERLLDEVTLFLHTLESNLSPSQRKMIHLLHDGAATLQGKRVLLVDDDIRNTFALSSVLRKNGLDVTMADDGKLALEKLATEPAFDLVLMDIMMPVMDGYEAMQKIRAQKIFAKLPIIALTAQAMNDDRQKCIQAGASDYLPKPVEMDRLLSMMRLWLFERPH
ncbi:MAG: CheY-like chemotaxis protein [Motiliproteus sp.]|jgi:CheY-like chemotaxis protein